jgi:hypothetical protein
MKIFVNELSFNGELENRDEAFSALKKLSEIASEAKKQGNGGDIFRHRDLKNRKLIGDVTIIEYLNSLHREEDPKKRTTLDVFLRIFAKAPFVSNAHGENDEIIDSNGNCLKTTCFDDASGSCCGSAVLSLMPNKYFHHHEISVKSSIHGELKILNLTDLAKTQDQTRTYEAHTKHARKCDGFVDGEIHSAMDLNDNEAQHVLTNGILIGKSVFNLFNERWYKFHPHGNGKFHGFPIKDNSNLHELSLAKKFLTSHGGNQHGQVDINLLPNK